MVYQLKNWSIIGQAWDNFTAPEYLKKYLYGKIYGREDKFPDGSNITTSSIISVDGRFITTKSGSVYELVGDPDPGYLKFLEEIGKTYDPINPIKIINNKDSEPVEVKKTEFDDDPNWN